MIYESYARELGCENKEVDVFCTLFGSPQAMTISELAKALNVQRTVLHPYVRSLLSKTLIRCTKEPGVDRYELAQPDDIRLIVEKKKEEVAKLEFGFLQMEKVLKSMEAAKADTHAIVKEGDEVEPYMKVRVPIWNQSIDQIKTVYGGFQDKTFPQKFSEWIDWYWSHDSSKLVTLRLLTNRSVFEDRIMRKKKFAKRIIRYWKTDKEITYSIWLMGEYVAFVYTRRKPYRIIEIHDPFLASTLYIIFEYLWESVTAGKNS